MSPWKHDCSSLMTSHQILEDITGVPFTQSKGVSESYRWFAPELCSAPGVISTYSDVFAYGMTVVEVGDLFFVLHHIHIIVQCADNDWAASIFTHQADYGGSDRNAKGRKAEETHGP